MKKSWALASALVLIASGNLALAAETPSWTQSVVMNKTGTAGFVTLKAQKGKPQSMLCTLPKSPLIQSIETAMGKDSQKLGEQTAPGIGIFQAQNKQYSGYQLDDAPASTGRSTAGSLHQ